MNLFSKVYFSGLGGGLVLYGLLLHYVRDALFLVSEFLGLGLVLLLLVPTVAKLVNLVRQRTLPSPWLAVPVLALVAYWFVLDHHIDDAVAVSLEVPRLETVVTAYRNQGKAARPPNTEADGPMLAFPWVSGLIDNGVGLVFDDTGTMDRGIRLIAADRDYFTSAAFQEIKKSFGGDVVSIKKVRENWYLCSFT